MKNTSGITRGPPEFRASAEDWGELRPLNRHARTYTEPGATRTPREQKRGSEGSPFVRQMLSAYGAEHPVAYFVRKQEKSDTFSTGCCVLLSQFA
jgi:hypothetical protein